MYLAILKNTYKVSSVICKFHSVNASFIPNIMLPRNMSRESLAYLVILHAGNGSVL